MKKMYFLFDKIHIILRMFILISTFNLKQMVINNLLNQGSIHLDFDDNKIRFGINILY